ncbi:MAG: molybdenum cofactor guanylyltransferase, partial [Chloroflexi bacterium]|nr:molybdenum cofactor guanylyltransferase [Chloroflexota bacterium]
VCLPAIEKKILADDLKIAGFFDDVRVKFVAERDVDSFDPDHLSFFNINTEQDLQKAAELVSRGR